MQTKEVVLALVRDGSSVSISVGHQISGTFVFREALEIAHAAVVSQARITFRDADALGAQVLELSKLGGPLFTFEFKAR